MGKNKAPGGKMKAFEVLQDDIAAIAAAAGTTLAGVLGEAPTTESMTNWQIPRVTFTPTLAVIGNSLGTLNVRQLRAGAVVATVATILLATGTTYAAEVPVVVPITGTPVLVAGDVLDVQYVQTGAGLALPLSTVKAELN
jgi:cytochrome bd-type quinol oxidase subunit 2